MSDDKPKAAPDPSSAYYQEVIKNGLKSLEASANAINDEVAKRQRKVPEAYFLHTLLPIVRAWIRRDPDVAIGLWLNVADGLHNSIEVQDVKGQTLFFLPPPYASIPDRTQRPDEKTRHFSTVNHVLRDQADMIDNGMTRDAMRIDNELVQLFTPRPEDDEKTRHLMVLVDIYDRYDLPLEELLGSAADEIRALIKQKKAQTKPALKVVHDEAPNEDDLQF